MKIYTRKGDGGFTGLLTGERVLKNDPFVEAYGTIDELNSALGFLLTLSPPENIIPIIGQIQSDLFEIGNILAMGIHSSKRDKKPPISINVKNLESAIDMLDGKLPPLRNFILPGGTQAGAWAHVCRCICRRAERTLVNLAFLPEVQNTILPYINRLSDFLFVIARYINFTLGSPEKVWKKQEATGKA